MNIVQIASATKTGTIVGGDLGPGTRAMVDIEATFSSPVTAGNAIVVIVAGRIQQANLNLFQFGLAGTVGTTGGGSLPSRTYNVQVSFTSSTGLESQLSAVTVQSVGSGSLLTVSHPNPNLSVLPGCTAWHVYINGALAGNLLPTEDFTEVTSTGSGGAPGPMLNCRDNAGNSYLPLLFTNGGAGGTAQGVEMMSAFVVPAALASTPTVTFACVGYNQNSFMDAGYDLCLIACEVAGIGGALSGNGAASTQQNSTTGDLTVAFAGSRLNVTTDFGTQTSCAASVVNLSGTGDFFFAFETGDDLAVSPVTPTVNTSGTLVLVTSVTSSGGLPLFLWAGGPISIGLLPDWLVINEPGLGLTVRSNYLYKGHSNQHSFSLELRQRGQATIHLYVPAGDSYTPTRGSPCYLWDQTVRGFELVFSGLIEDLEYEYFDNGGDHFVIITAVTFESVLDTVMVTYPVTYSAQSCGAILADLFDRFENGCQIALGSISAGASVALFNPQIGDKLSDILDQLATTSEFIWRVDPSTLLLYFGPPFLLPAPFEVVSSSIAWDQEAQLTWKANGRDYRNRQGVKLSFDAFPHSKEFIVGTNQQNITLMRPVNQITNAYITPSTPNTATLNFTGQPNNLDTFTIGPLAALWRPSHIYGLGGFIVVNGFVQQVSTAGTSGSTEPNFSTVTGATTVDNTMVWTCLGPSGLDAGPGATQTYTFVTALDNTQFGQVLIGANLAASVQNAADAINATDPYGGSPASAGRGITFSLPTWENSQVNAINVTGTSLEIQQKSAGTGWVSQMGVDSTQFTFSSATTVGGTSPPGFGTFTIQAYQVGTSTAAPAVQYTQGSAQIRMATPLDVGSNLNVEYTRVGGDVIQVEDTPLVTALAAITKGTGKVQQFTDQSTLGLISTNAAAGLQLAQQILAAYGVVPQELSFSTFLPGLLPGMQLQVLLSKPTVAGSQPVLNALWVVETVEASLVPVTWRGATPWLSQNPAYGHYKYTVKCVNIQEIASYLDFWEGLGGGGSGSGGTGGGFASAGAVVPTSGGATPSGPVAGYPAGVQFKNASYTLVDGDKNTLLVVQNASPYTAVTLTLPNPPTSTTWQVEITNDSSHAVTISPNGLLLDGLSSSLTLGAGAGIEIRTDGVNYFTQPGSGSGGFANPMTTLGDIIVGASGGAPARKGVGANGKVLTANSGATDGLDYEAPIALTTTGTGGPASLTAGNPYELNIPQYQPLPPDAYCLELFFTTPVGGSALLGQAVIGEAVTFPNNFSTSFSAVGTNPTGTQTWTVKKNGSSIGTIAISTGGVVTFSVSGPVSFAAGDVFQIYGSSGATDATLANVSLAIVAVRGTVPATPTVVLQPQWVGLIPSSQLILQCPVPVACSAPANFAGIAFGFCVTNPTSTATFTVKKNGSTIGTVAISTGGVFAFATSGGAAVSFVAGDVIDVVAPSSADATLASVSMCFTLSTGAFVQLGGDLGNTTTSPQVIGINGHSIDNLATDSGSANTYVVAPPSTYSRTTGTIIAFKAANANTGASTLDDGGGAVAIKKAGSAGLVSGDISAGQIVWCEFDGTNWQMISWSGAAGGGGGGGGLIGKAIFSAAGGSISGLVTSGCISGVTRTSTGNYAVTFSSTQSNYIVSIQANDNNAWNLTINIEGTATSPPGSGFSFKTLVSGVAFEDPPLVMVGVFA